MQRLELSDWASLAEVASGVAVVITLVFLILGIQENTEVTRAAVYDRNIDSLNAVRSQIVTDPDVARLWSAFQSQEVEALDDLDKARLEMLINMIFGVYEKSYFANKYGVLGPVEWSRFTGQICLQHGRLHAAPSIRAPLEGVVTKEFLDYMDALCQQAD